jgi:hypothetical protein
MEKLIKYFFYSFLMISTSNCNNTVKTYPYENNKSISSLDGYPFDSMRTYIPMHGDSIGSYMYYIMKEPILYNYYLNKDIYRVRIIRSFAEPIVIRIENDGEETKIITKKLSRNVSYPFIVYGRDLYEQLEFPEDVAILNAAGEVVKVINEKKYKDLIEIHKQHEDSMSKIYNVTDYNIIFQDESDLDKSAWDSISLLVKNSNFWTSGYNSFVNNTDPDGSTWVIEGQSKFGYQCIKIDNPFAPIIGSGYENKTELDKIAYQNKIKSQYAKLFKYIVSKTKLVNEKIK